MINFSLKNRSLIVSFKIPFTKFKYFEFEFYIANALCSWLFLIIVLRDRQDHGGLRFELSLLKLFAVMFNFYDSRHWNYDENRWEDPTKLLDPVTLSKTDANNFLGSLVRFDSTLSGVFREYSNKSEFVKSTEYFLRTEITNLENWLREIVYSEKS